MTDQAGLSSNPRRRGAPELVVGVVVLALALLAGALDLGIGLQNWDSYSPVKPSDPVPEFRVRLSDGSVLDSSELRGQVTLLTFWATWCHACGLEMPTITAIDRAYAGTDLRVYGVNRDSGEPREREAAVAAYMAKRDMGFLQVYDDGLLAQAFGVEAIPYMVIVDRRGDVRHMHMGQVSERTLRNEIDGLLAE